MNIHMYLGNICDEQSAMTIDIDTDVDIDINHSTPRVIKELVEHT